MIDFDMLLVNLISAAISGSFLMIGIYFGERLTSRAIPKIMTETISKAPMVAKLSEMMEAINSILGNKEKMEKVIGFFEEARNLMTSPEAKNFFINATVALKQFTEKPAETKIELNIPEIPETTGGES